MKIVMSPKNQNFQTILCVCVLAIAFGYETAAAQSVGSISSPLPNAWVVDRTDTLSDLQKKLINELCEEIQTDYNRQLVVAVIDSTNGKEHRRFAVELFNRWRVGGGYKNQGVLVFAAMKDRASEIVLGHGIDNRDTVRAAQSIMDKVVIPKFKAGDAGSAIYEGVFACSKQIIGVGKLKVAPKLPEITAEQPVVTAEKPIEPGADIPDPATVDAMLSEMEGSIENSNLGSTEAGTDQTDAASGVLAEAAGFRPLPVPARSTAPRSTAPRSIPRNSSAPRRHRVKTIPSYLPWVFGLGGVGLIGSFFGVRHYLRYRSRMCETCRIDRVLLTEVQDDDFLNKPMRRCRQASLRSLDDSVFALPGLQLCYSV